MKYQNLGNSGIKVSRVAFGAWQIGGGTAWDCTDDSACDRSACAKYGEIGVKATLFFVDESKKSKRNGKFLPIVYDGIDENEVAPRRNERG